RLRDVRFDGAHAAAHLLGDRPIAEAGRGELGGRRLARGEALALTGARGAGVEPWHRGRDLRFERRDALVGARHAAAGASAQVDAPRFAVGVQAGGPEAVAHEFFAGADERGGILVAHRVEVPANGRAV